MTHPQMLHFNSPPSTHDLLLLLRFFTTTQKVRPENVDDNMPGHRAAGVHGVIVDNRLVDAAPM